MPVKIGSKIRVWILPIGDVCYQGTLTMGENNFAEVRGVWVDRFFQEGGATEQCFSGEFSLVGEPWSERVPFSRKFQHFQRISIGAKEFITYKGALD